ncbi:chemotaxis response regulator protein-glutamate methylesterase [Sphingomonas oligoaromativorans]|uniref:chemotaxis response regulator protein-glutamate methylesterase n=1 Tax=Sphingomonas oligoaromativorans TaxID=575322 RepID=UPI0014231221|nr:chemotaxis response regulator protein-glutamate methylesterase [Sphingomonas oligoaromativorans]NIJ33930.1 chemotaxis response regulator CheB [Sphingomonas oligoaromativorans]
MRIGIVNDMVTATEALRRIVATAPEHQVVWTAVNGAEAVRMCAADLPDLVLMDLIMPEMDGVEATRRIMAETPCPILIVTSSVEDQAARVFAAMGHGALDAIDTPALGSADPQWAARPLLAKIRALNGLTGGVRPAEGRQTAPRRRSGAPLIAIGASAGGPAALAMILETLPRDFPAAIAIVQHIDERFAAGMAGWLAMHSAVPVRIAAEGAVPQAGTALLAGTSDHMVAKAGGRLGYTQRPAEAIYRPSIDVFFDSLCAHWSGEIVGVLLTGMGSDGARGLKALRDAGHHTIAQDRATSAVYGMPKAAAALSAAVEILPLDGIAPALAGLFTQGHRKGGSRWTC